VIYRHRVRYHEVDAQQHVYNARYLEYIDVAFTEFVREVGWDYADAVERGFDPVLARAEVDFLAGARFDEILEIVVTPERLGSSSLEVRFEIQVEAGRPVAAVFARYVNFDTGSRSSAPIPQAIREQLQARIQKDGS
jgi:acyl-CoA thioester hydrolase